MAISYKKLWKLLIDRNMLKTDLRLAAGLTTNVIAKLGRNENVSTEVLGKICKTLNCDITDIMEFVDDDQAKRLKAGGFSFLMKGGHPHVVQNL